MPIRDAGTAVERSGSSIRPVSRSSRHPRRGWRSEEGRPREGPPPDRPVGSGPAPRRDPFARTRARHRGRPPGVVGPIDGFRPAARPARSWWRAPAPTAGLARHLSLADITLVGVARLEGRPHPGGPGRFTETPPAAPRPRGGG